MVFPRSCQQAGPIRCDSSLASAGPTGILQNLETADRRGRDPPRISQATFPCQTGT